MAEVARLLVAVEANTAQAEAGIASLHKKLTLAAIGFGVIVVAAAAVGIAATKMAGDYQAGIMTLQTGAGEYAKNIDMVRKGILDMAVDTGTSTKQLIAGMFMIESAGYHGAAGLTILRAAAEGAKVGNADLGATANALTTIMVDYAGRGVTAAQATNTLIAIVSHGKTHMQDLATSISTVLPAAAKYGVSLTDVSAALATMTMQNGDAAASTTYLRQLLTSLASPSGASAKALKEIGLTSQEVSDDMKKSLPDTLVMITKAIDNTFPPGSVKANEAFKAIAGGSRQMQGMLLLTGGSMKTFKQDVLDISGAVKEGGNSIVGWSAIQGDFNLQMSKAREMLETAFITLGQHLLPKLTEVVKFIVEHAGPAVQGLTKFFQQHRTEITIAAILIGGALTAAFLAWAGSALAAAAGTIAATWPVLAIGAAIAGLIALLIYGYTHWGWFKTAVDAAGFAIKWAAGEVGILLGILGRLIDKIGGLLDKLRQIGSAAGNAFGNIGKAIGSIHIPGFASGTGYAPGGPAMLAEGGGPELVMRPGVYNLPRGSTVLNAQDTAKAMGGGGQHSQTINIYPQKADLDSDDLARHLRRVALLATTSGGY
jgi:TP901 family phage tail tape measure protein